MCRVRRAVADTMPHNVDFHAVTGPGGVLDGDGKWVNAHSVRANAHLLGLGMALRTVVDHQPPALAQACTGLTQP